MRRFCSALVLVLTGAAITFGTMLAQQPQGRPAPSDAPAAPRAVAKWRQVTTADGKTFDLVPRAQLKAKSSHTTLKVPKFAPAPPATFDWTQGNKLNFPILGNDTYGDCYYADMCHLVQTWTGNVGTEATFDVSAVTKRYLAISGGDNGLSDSDIYGTNHNGEFYGGIVGPNGPHKILDNMLVSVSDTNAIATSMYYFGGLSLTVSLCDQWVANPKAGDTWDAGTANPNYGHAITLNAVTGAGKYKLQTWGFNPPITLTQAGLQSADPELMVCFSLDWFDPKTGIAPNGYSYTDLAALWVSLGGKQLPPSPFGPAPPNPPVPPVPTTGTTITLSAPLAAGTYQVVPSGSLIVSPDTTLRDLFNQFKQNPSILKP